jgi:hypothetical protein
LPYLDILVILAKIVKLKQNAAFSRSAGGGADSALHLRAAETVATAIGLF